MRKSGAERRKDIRATLMRINPNALDETILTHVDLYDKVAVALQLAIAKRDTVKAEMAELESEFSVAAMDDLKKSGIARPTKDNIAHWIGRQENILNIRRLFRKYDQNVKGWAVLKESVVQRGYAIKHFAELQAQKIKAGLSGYTVKER